MTSAMKALSGRNSSDEEPDTPTDRRSFPAPALALMLVVGVVLGLLFAAVISSLLDGSDTSSASSSTKRTTGASSSASGTTSSGTTSSGNSTSTSSTTNSGLAVTEHLDKVHAAHIAEDRDARITNCGTDANGFASALVWISNSTQHRATYHVRVIFATASDGRTISDDVASAIRLPSGHSAPAVMVHAVDQAPGEAVNCRLGSVSRY